MNIVKDNPPRKLYRKATINDVASSAGVSITTVSHFVSGRTGTCSPETAERIKRAINELHYTPNSISRSLSQQRTQIIGVSMANPAHDESPFTDRVWRGLNSEADSRDYALLHYPASMRNSDNHRLFLDGRVDGLILSGPQGDTRPANLAAAGMPTVLLTRSIDVPSGCGSVYADERVVVDIALSHLWNAGHRRIAHMVGPSTDASTEASPILGKASDSAIWRMQEFLSWMKSKGVTNPLISPSNDNWEPTHVKATLDSWFRLSEPPTAIFCANDQIAVATLEHAHALGWRVPEQLSVIGVDNSHAGTKSMPPLTTVEVDGEQIGRDAIQCLLRLMEGHEGVDCRVAIASSTLVERNSTQPVLKA